MWRVNALTRRLSLESPIVQGPFGSGLSSVELVAAVSNAGGLGSFGVHHLNAAGIREVSAKIRARTDRPFALNLWIPLHDSEDPHIEDEQFARAVANLAPYFAELNVEVPTRPARFTPPFAEQMEAVLEAKPAVFSFVFGIPDAPILERCRELGIFTLGAATTVDEAKALERADVDGVVASGFEAGGHRISFLRSAEESLTGTLALIPQVVDAVSIPVVAAGGIADGRGVAAALCLGAQGAQIGTAFLACEESAAGDLHRAALHSPKAGDTSLTRAFTGRLARGIRNRFIDETRSIESQVPHYPVQAWLTAHLKKASIAQGRTDLMSLWSGQAARLIRQRNASALMSELVRDTSAALSRFG